jgi:NitT/TauT family transport system substrate-binding protein
MHLRDRPGLGSRRQFVAGSSALIAASLLGHPSGAAVDPPPEIATLRIPNWSTVICVAPNYLAEALLRAEGFTDIQYVEPSYPGPGQSVVSTGNFDFDLNTAQVILTYLDAGAPLVTLAGVHLGCYELFGNSRIGTIRDLKGKTVPVTGMGSDKHVFLSSMVAYVGLDPQKDINWIKVSSTEAMKLFVEGKVDAFLGFPPEPQELRAEGIGRVIVNTAIDKPWSQYYCCMLYAHRDFVRMYPAATKRVVRAILKAADLCAQEPERAAREIVEKGYIRDYKYALETLREVPYNVWRSHVPEDTLRFYGLRLHEARIIKTPPNKLIAQGTDWRFLEQLKMELKA